MIQLSERLLVDVSFISVAGSYEADIGLAAVDFNFFAVFVVDLDGLMNVCLCPCYVDDLAVADVVTGTAFFEEVVCTIVIVCKSNSYIEDEYIGYCDLVAVVLVDLRIAVLALVVETVTFVILEVCVVIGS